MMDDYPRFILALVFVLGLVGLLAYGARRFGLTPRATVALGGGRRLNVVEVLNLDGRRRLVLIRRDGVEHLILLGAEGESVVERDIKNLSQGTKSEP